ncbi:MAG: hypothetical protein LBU87_04220 [Lactobacillales bacterium]|jgi:hypothetical protein|nr:hypothetical protein [Lactobacillales bacterium]
MAAKPLLPKTFQDLTKFSDSSFMFISRKRALFIYQKIDFLIKSLTEELKKEKYCARVPFLSGKKDHVLYQWEKKCGFKTHVLGLTVPKPQRIDDSRYLQLYLQIELPITDSLNNKVIFDRIGSSFNFPFSWLISGRNYFKKIHSFFQNAPSWFDHYTMPKNCMDQLQTGQTHLGRIKNYGTAKNAFDYLKTFIKTEKTPSKKDKCITLVWQYNYGHHPQKDLASVWICEGNRPDEIPDIHTWIKIIGPVDADLAEEVHKNLKSFFKKQNITVVDEGITD